MVGCIEGTAWPLWDNEFRALNSKLQVSQRKENFLLLLVRSYCIAQAGLEFTLLPRLV